MNSLLNQNFGILSYGVLLWNFSHFVFFTFEKDIMIWDFEHIELGFLILYLEISNVAW